MKDALETISVEEKYQEIFLKSRGERFFKKVPTRAKVVSVERLKQCIKVELLGLRYLLDLGFDGKVQPD